MLTFTFPHMSYAIKQSSTGTEYKSNSIISLFAKFGRAEGYWFAARFCFAMLIAN
jgi:hypothetical protein